MKRMIACVLLIVITFCACGTPAFQKVTDIFAPKNDSTSETVESASEQEPETVESASEQEPKTEESATPMTTAEPTPTLAPVRAPLSQEEIDEAITYIDYLGAISDIPFFANAAEMDPKWVATGMLYRTGKEKIGYIDAFGVSLQDVQNAAQEKINPDILLPTDLDYNNQDFPPGNYWWEPEEQGFWYRLGGNSRRQKYFLMDAYMENGAYVLIGTECAYTYNTDPGQSMPVLCAGKEIATAKADKKTGIDQFDFLFPLDALPLSKIVLKPNGNSFHIISKINARNSDGEIIYNSSEDTSPEGLEGSYKASLWYQIKEGSQQMQFVNSTCETNLQMYLDNPYFVKQTDKWMNNWTGSHLSVDAKTVLNLFATLLQDGSNPLIYDKYAAAYYEMFYGTIAPTPLVLRTASVIKSMGSKNADVLGDCKTVLGITQDVTQIEEYELAVQLMDIPIAVLIDFVKKGNKKVDFTVSEAKYNTDILASLMLLQESGEAPIFLEKIKKNLTGVLEINGSLDTSTLTFGALSAIADSNEFDLTLTKGRGNYEKYRNYVDISNRLGDLARFGYDPITSKNIDLAWQEVRKSFDGAQDVVIAEKSSNEMDVWFLTKAMDAAIAGSPPIAVWNTIVSIAAFTSYEDQKNADLFLRYLGAHLVMQQAQALYMQKVEAVPQLIEDYYLKINYATNEAFQIMQDDIRAALVTLYLARGQCMEYERQLSNVFFTEGEVLTLSASAPEEMKKIADSIMTLGNISLDQLLNIPNTDSSTSTEDEADIIQYLANLGTDVGFPMPFKDANSIDEKWLIEKYWTQAPFCLEHNNCKRLADIEKTVNQQVLPEFQFSGNFDYSSIAGGFPLDKWDAEEKAYKFKPSGGRNFHTEVELVHLEQQGDVYVAEVVEFNRKANDTHVPTWAELICDGVTVGEIDYAFTYDDDGNGRNKEVQRKMLYDQEELPTKIYQLKKGENGYYLLSKADGKTFG